MTLGAFKKLLEERVTMPRFPIPIQFVRVLEYPWGEVSVHIQVRAKDRDGGPDLPIYSSHTLPIEEVEQMDDLSAAAWLLEKGLLSMMNHELREHFLVDGRRVFDPHLPPVTRVEDAVLATPVAPGKEYHLTDLLWKLVPGNKRP